MQGLRLFRRKPCAGIRGQGGARWADFGWRRVAHDRTFADQQGRQGGGIVHGGGLDRFGETGGKSLTPRRDC